MINENYFPKGSKVLIIHTGGLWIRAMQHSKSTSSNLAVSTCKIAVQSGIRK